MRIVSGKIDATFAKELEVFCAATVVLRSLTWLA
jgi:hypothetical protein